MRTSTTIPVTSSEEGTRRRPALGFALVAVIAMALVAPRAAGRRRQPRDRVDRARREAQQIGGSLAVKLTFGGQAVTLTGVPLTSRSPVLP